MSKFYKPINDPKEWRWLLAKPYKHWKEGRSAKSLAYCWQRADDFPKSVKKVFKNSNIELFRDIEMLMAFPEYRVAFPPKGGRPSQNDIFILAKGNGKLISITVEGKAGEPFDDTIDDWKLKDYGGKGKRLDYLCKILQLDKTQIGHIRYQLLHRTASAIILAEKFSAKNALMLIHSFQYNEDSFKDYCNFLRLFGRRGEINTITTAKTVNGVKLFFGWVKET